MVQNKIVNQKEKNLLETINGYEEGKTYYLELIQIFQKKDLKIQKSKI